MTAIGRAVLACVLCLSLLVGPEANAMSDRVVSTLLLGYAAYSLLFLAATRSRAFVYRVLANPIVPTAFDLVLFTSVIYLSKGAVSPFFSPFVFLIITATIQWGSRGALIMGLLTMAAFAPAGWAAAYGVDRDPQGAQTFILRMGYVFVISVLLATFGRHIERMVEELSRLSAPLSEEGDEAQPPIVQCLRHALWVFGARSGAFLWGEEEEPYLTLTMFDGERVENRRLVSAGDAWLIDPSVASAPFLFDRGSGNTFLRRGRATTPGPRHPLGAQLLNMLEFERALVIPAATPGLAGWVLILDHDEPANEDLAAGAMVGGQISVALERWETQGALRSAAAAEDRLRLARDLHDGVLQFLAGAGLQLDAMIAGGDLSEGVRGRVANLRHSIADEQRELRGFITTLRPARAREIDSQRSLGDLLVDLSGRLSRHWSVNVESEVRSADLSTSTRLAYDISRIVREAVANAVRHGKASHVRVAATRSDDQLIIEIQDNGCGFPFQGRRTDAELSRAGLGPRSLHERVRTLAGQLTLNSTPRGAALTIDLPLPEAG